MSYTAIQKVYLDAQKNCGLAPGDFVRVLRVAENEEAGWQGIWPNVEENKIVEKIFKIKAITNRGIRLKNNPLDDEWWYVPYFVLEKVERQEYNLKPFDRVLVRDRPEDIWRPNFFAYMDGDDYCCIDGHWDYAIPYEGNELLVGKNWDVDGAPPFPKYEDDAEEE